MISRMARRNPLEYAQAQRNKTSSLVSSEYNKSGIGLTGPSGSGPNAKIDYKKSGSKTQRLTAAKKSGFYRGPKPTGVGGSGSTPKSGWVGEGDKRHYYEAPAAHREGHAPAAPAKAEKPSERPAPSSSLARTLASKTSASPKSGSQKQETSAKASSGKDEMTLNDFMMIANASGKSNAYRRGYQMFKNYKRTGKLPNRRVRPES